MAATHVFPQVGDNDDPENFAQTIGHDILSDYVVTGMGFTPDYTVPDVTVGDGLCFISLTSDTSTSESETRLSVNHAVQVASATLALTDNAVNYIYVEPDFSTDDNASYAAYTDTTNASADALKIGEVDTSNNTSTETNRIATLSDVTVSNTTNVGGDIQTVGGTTVFDYANGWVPQAQVEQGSGSGLDADTVDANEPADMVPTYSDGTTNCFQVRSNKFGSEGSSTTSTSYTTIAASDITFDPDEFRDTAGNLYIRIFGHLKHSTNSGTAYCRMYRQNAASAVSGTEISVSANDGWGTGDTGWVSFGDSGWESYQLQLKSGDGESVSYNSVILYFGTPV